nr:hydrogen gas-evolving membrane-bound hydrogenase subunit E [Rhabdothermincola salaria]
MSDNVLLMFGFWELTSITSFLLVGTNDEMPSARSAALHALLVTGGGGLAMLGGLVLIGQAAGTYSLSEIVAAPPSGTTVSVGVGLVLLGALTKSAQVPFHSWLPGAMAAPTPISAYLHSATMVKAGVFLVARFSPAFATLGVWRWMVLGAGTASLLLGGYRALRQHDIKLVLAYGTISQLGLLMILFGAGTEETALAGCVLLLAHAAFKASLFLTVGIVDHQTHTRDLRSLSGLGRRWPIVAGAAALAAASMAGIPPLFGFIAKEYALKGYLEPNAPAHIAILTAIVVGSMFTVAYSARFLWGAFGPAEDHGPDGTTVGADAAHPSALFAGAPVVLGVIGLVLGVAPMLADPLVGGGLEALGYGDGSVSLHLWSGFNAALGLSALVIAGGAVLFLARRRVERVQEAMPHVPSALLVYERSLAGLLQGSGRLTAITQSGSLPVYLAVIVLTAVVAPLVPLLSVGGPEVWPSWVDSPLQVVLAVIVVVTALSAAFAHRRFVAVLFLGAAGYAVVGLFLVQGAPDLALTQVLVETLSIVAFVLVLRHLPERFAPTRVPLRRVLPAAMGVLVAAFVFVFLITASGVRDTDLTAGGASAASSAGDATLSEEFLARAEVEANGRNVVNVVLVDFRGFDTMGEITVIVVAALGIVALVAAGRRRPDGTGDGEGGDGDDDGLSHPVPVDQSVDVPEPGSAKVESGGVG